MTRRQPGPSRFRSAVTRARIAPAVRAAAEATLLADLSTEVFSLDLSNPATHPAAEALLAGRLSILRAMGSPVVGGAR